MNLNDKVAIVLGAVKGIGKEIGLALANEGVKVALTHYDWEDSLESMKNDFSKFGDNHLILKTNLLSEIDIASFIDKTIEKFGRIDILINNIERGGMPVVHGIYNEEQWDMEMATTLRAKRWVFDKAFPHLKKTGAGSVINISSIAGIVGRSGPASLIFNEGYSAANRGISLLTETWARIGGQEVRVNELMLGIFETRHGDKTRGWGLLTKEERQALVDHTLSGRLGKVDDIIKAVMFLLKDAPYMTGSIMKLDGGYTLGGEKVLPMPKGVV